MITPLQLTDFPVAVLYILAVASIGIYGIVFAGWSSGSTYPLLGSLRSSAQMISYEIAMGLAFVAVFLYAGSMSTSQIVAAQQPIWYALILLPSFIIYVTAMVGETNRAPFDLPEAESELVAGFHTEYSSLKFALFFLAEYINMVTVSALATTLFLGGWQAPWPISAINDGMLNRGWWGLLWFLVKVSMFLFLFIWLRGTHESCGKCTPCREGTGWIAGTLEKFEAGHGSEHELGMLEEICGQILGRSFCALGDAAATPFPAALKHFPDEFLAGTHTAADVAFNPAAATVLPAGATR